MLSPGQPLVKNVTLTVTALLGLSPPHAARAAPPASTMPLIAVARKSWRRVRGRFPAPGGSKIVSVPSVMMCSPVDNVASVGTYVQPKYTHATNFPEKNPLSLLAINKNRQKP